MFNRYLILTVTLFTSIPLPMSAMDLSQKESTYITQCCYKSITKEALQKAKDTARNSNKSVSCPFCNSSFLEVIRSDKFSQQILSKQKPVSNNSNVVPDLISFNDEQPVSKPTVPDLISFENDQQPATKKIKAETKECRICDETMAVSAFTQLPCKHNFYCQGCLNDILKNAIKEKTTKAMRCPQCKQQFDDSFINPITNYNQDTLNKIYDVMTLELLKQDQETKNCPTPDCTYMYLAPANAVPYTTKCPQCKQIYCSHCLFKHSERMGCKEAEEFRNLSTDKSEAEKKSEEWAKQNTKPCPKCTKLIQWDGGCEKVTCSQCQHLFCYVCLEPVTWTSAHHCKAEQTTTTSQTNNTTTTNTNAQQDFLRQMLLQAMFQPVQMPEVSAQPQAMITNQTNNTYVVQFDRQIDEEFFYNFVSFVLSKSGKTSFMFTDYQTFMLADEQLSLESTETPNVFANIIKEANNNKFE